MTYAAVCEGWLCRGPRDTPDGWFVALVEWGELNARYPLASHPQDAWGERDYSDMTRRRIGDANRVARAAWPWL